MNRRIYILLLFFMVVCPKSYGQTTKDEIFKDLRKSGGVYYAYQPPCISQTAAPKGYAPFYICMYGRHGSRYLLGDKDYSDMIGLLSMAAAKKALSPLGGDVLSRLRTVYVESKGRGGDLSPLGVKQYRAIAERMYRSYPSVFNDSSSITARSTLVIRSIFSMDAFCERLKELNPRLYIPRDATNRDAEIMSYHTQSSDAFDSDSSPWHAVLHQFESSLLKPERLVNSLFIDKDFVRRHVNPENLMWSLYWIASDMQDIESETSFYDVFAKQELFDLWQCFNARFYMTCGNYEKNGGIPFENEKPLLNDMMTRASAYIKGGKTGATFYFGHDMNLMRLLSLIRAEGLCGKTSDPADIYKIWSDFKIAPMAGNFQMIFFRNPGSSDVLVKFMLNERECRIPINSDMLPYYHWQDVSTYMRKICETDIK